MARTIDLRKTLGYCALAVALAALLAILQPAPKQIPTPNSSKPQPAVSAPLTAAAPLSTPALPSGYRPLSQSAAKSGPFLPVPPRFSEAGPDTFEAQAATYTATVSADGLRG